MWIAVFACLMVVATATLVPIPSSSGVAYADVVRPDPPTVTMTCQPGQFDINTTDPNAIVVAFAIDLAVAKRWVAQGPWLRPSDLLTVQGVGPGWLTPRITANRLCALPPRTPPPVFDVCIGSRIDVQTASATELRNAFGMSNNAVSSFLATRPFQRLSQINPERTPGLGTSSQLAIMRKGCITPASIVTSTTNWRWAYPNTTTTNQREKFALRVRAGTLPTSTGAWLSISDSNAAGSPLVGPAADFHIWTDWSDGVRTVTVTVPLARPASDADAQNWTPAVVHFTQSSDSDSELAVNDGINVDTTNGVASAEVTSLSTVQSSRLPSRTAPNNITTFLTHRTWSEDVFRWWTGIRGEQPTCTPSQANDSLIGLRGDMFDYQLMTGDFPFLWCLEGSTPGASRLKLVDNTAVAFDVQSDGLLPLYQSADVRRFLSSGDALTDYVFSHRNGLQLFQDGDEPFINHALVPPAAGLVLQLSQSSDTTLSAKPNAAMTNWAFLFRHISDAIPQEKVKVVYDALNECGWANATTTSAITAVLNCVKAIGNALLSAVAGVALFSIEAMAQAADFQVGELDGHWSYKSPVSPPPAGGGTLGPDGTIVDGAKGPGFLWRLANGDQRDSTVYLILPTGQAAGANDFIDSNRVSCLSRRYPLRDFAPRSEIPWAQELAAPAPCPDTPELTLPSNARHWILRNGDGHAFYVDGQSHLQSIADGGTYIACAQTYLVLDFVPYSVINQFGNSDAAPQTHSCS